MISPISIPMLTNLRSERAPGTTSATSSALDFGGPQRARNRDAISSLRSKGDKKTEIRGSYRNFWGSLHGEPSCDRPINMSAAFVPFAISTCCGDQRVRAFAHDHMAHLKEQHELPARFPSESGHQAGIEDDLQEIQTTKPRVSRASAPPSGSGSPDL
jgi:hypothetical protein